MSLDMLDMNACMCSVRVWHTYARHERAYMCSVRVWRVFRYARHERMYVFRSSLSCLKIC